MKVLIIPSWYPTEHSPLNGSFIREQAELSAADHDVKVLYPQILGKKEYLQNLTRADSLLSKRKPLAPPAAETVLTLDVVKASETAQLKLLLAKCRQKLSQLLRQNWKPDLIHSHVTFRGGIIGVALAQEFGIPSIVTEHSGPFLLDEYSPRVKNLIKTSLEKANVVATLSNHQSRALLSYNLKIDPVIVGEMVDDATFTVAPKTKMIDKKVIVTVGGSIFPKDLETFLKALAILKEKGIKDFFARIISIKDVSEEHKKFIADNELNDFCECLIGVARDQMPEIYRECDAFVSTSIAETFGISMGEALSSGKPVIATRNGGAEDFIVDGVNGYLVNVKDYKALADKLVELLNGKIKTSPAEIRQSIVERFGRRAFKKRIDDVYNGVAGK